MIGNLQDTKLDDKDRSTVSHHIHKAYNQDMHVIPNKQESRKVDEDRLPVVRPLA